MLPRRCPILLALAAALTVAPAAGAQQRTLQILSDATSGRDAGIHSRFNLASEDGSRVYFDTTEPIVPTDTDTGSDSYERSPSGAFAAVTDDPLGPDTGESAYVLAASPDGAVVTFSTRERLLPSDVDDAQDVYTRIANVLFHVTDDPNGPDENKDASFETASRDGTIVVFSTAENLATTDTDAEADLYRRALGGPLLHVSDGAVAPDANAPARFATATDTAGRVFFETGSASWRATPTTRSTSMRTAPADFGM